MRTLIALVASVIIGAFAEKGGAPRLACVDMTPQHAGNKPQTSPSPYSVTVVPLTDGRYGGNFTLCVVQRPYSILQTSISV